MEYNGFTHQFPLNAFCENLRALRGKKSRGLQEGNTMYTKNHDEHKVSANLVLLLTLRENLRALCGKKTKPKASSK